jgi:hypothetical protein
MSKSSRVIDVLKTDTTYFFHLRAKNTMGIWSDLNIVGTHTTLKDIATPPPLSSIILLLLSGVFQLKWAKPTTLDLRGGGYKVYVFTANTPASAKLIREVGYTADSTEIFIGEKSQDASITITSGVTYWFWVTTLDDSGNESAKVATTPASGAVVAAAGTNYIVVNHNINTILTNADLGKIHIMDVSGGDRIFTLPDTDVGHIGYWLKLVRQGTAHYLRVQAGLADTIWNSLVGGFIECDDLLHDYSSVNLVQAAVGQWMTPEFGIWGSY